MGLFNDYYDEITYEERSGDKDISGQEIYLSPVKLKARQVSGGQIYKIEKDQTVITYTKEYQLPVHVNEGDLINGHIILNVQDSRNVFGGFEFCIAKVE